MNGYITKPIDWNEMIETVGRFTNLKMSERQIHEVNERNGFSGKLTNDHNKRNSGTTKNETERIYR